MLSVYDVESSHNYQKKKIYEKNINKYLYFFRYACFISQYLFNCNIIRNSVKGAV